MHTRRSALRLAALALSGFAGCTGNPSIDRRDATATGTPTAFGGTRTPTPGPATPSPTSDRLRWRYRTDGRLVADVAPLVVDGTAYAASDDLHAVEGGDRAWRVETAGERTRRPVRVDDRLYVLAGGPAGADTTLYSLSADGEIVWTVGVTDHAGHPRVAGATAEGAFVLGFEAPADTTTPSTTDTITTEVSYRPTARYVVAFDADGSERWRHRIGDVSGEWGGALQAGVLYARPPQTTTLYAFDATTGDVLWRFDRARYGPAVTSEGAFVVDVEGGLRLFALDGTERWRFSLPAGSPGYFAADGARAYLVSESDPADAEPSSIPSTLFAIGPRGDERWRFDSEGERFGRPVPRRGAVYAGSFEGRVYAIDDADGSERWVFPTDGKRTVSPVVGDGSIYAYEVAHNDLYAIEAGTGDGRWRFSPGALPALDAGVVYAGAENGTLYALSA